MLCMNNNVRLPRIALNAGATVTRNDCLQNGGLNVLNLTELADQKYILLFPRSM